MSWLHSSYKHILTLGPKAGAIEIHAVFANNSLDHLLGKTFDEGGGEVNRNVQRLKYHVFGFNII